MTTMDPIDRVFVSTPKSRSDGLRSALRLPKRRSAFGNSVGGIINTNVGAAGGADVEMAVVHDSLIKSSPAPKNTLASGFSAVFVGNSNSNQKQQLLQPAAIRVSSMPASPFRWPGSRDDDILIDNSHLSVTAPSTRESSPGSQHCSEWADILDLYEEQQHTPPATSSYDDFYGQPHISPPHTPQSSPKSVPRQRAHSFRSVSNPTTASPNRRPVPKPVQKPIEYEPAAPLIESIPLPPSPAAVAQVNKQPNTLKRLLDRDLMPWLANAKRRTPSGSSQKSQGNSNTTAKRESSSSSSRSKKSDTGSKFVKSRQMEFNAQYIIDQFRALSRRTIVLQPLDAIADFVPSLAVVVVIFEGLALMWLLYQLSVIVETLAMLIRAICLPLIIMSRIVGYM